MKLSKAQREVCEKIIDEVQSWIDNDKICINGFGEDLIRMVDDEVITEDQSYDIYDRIESLEILLRNNL